MVQYLNGQFMCHVFCKRQTIQIPDQYIRKQAGVHLSGQMVGLYGIQVSFKYQTIWHIVIRYKKEC